MVRPTPQPTSADAKTYTGKHSAAALAEEMRALLGLFASLKQMVAQWGKQVEHESDDTMVAVAYFYGDLCRDLDRRLVQLIEAVSASGEAIDLQPIREAREQLWLMTAFDPMKLLQSMRDVREGRVTTLEQMRRELRNRAQ